jgi:4'-phosphopantetheinyl transferase
VLVSRYCAHCGSTEHGQPSAVARPGATARPGDGAPPGATARPGPAHARDRAPVVRLSLARAGDLVAVAGRLTGAVGIDIELLDRVAAAGFDDVAFAASERAAIDDSPDPDALRAELWTAKEAVLKAAGTGLRTDPRLVEVRPGAVLALWTASDIPPGDVRLRSWRPRPGYVVALAEINAGTGTR